MWTLWALWGCGQPSGSDGQDAVAGDVDLELDPVGLDFGFVPFGESAQQSFTIHNKGTGDVLIAELVLSDPDSLAVIGFGSPKIRAGDEEQLAIEWTPSETGDLVDDSLDLRVGTQLDALSDVQVPLLGKVSGPHLTMSESSANLGTVKVGCSESFETVATNSGNEDLEISRISLTDDRGFVLEDGTGAPLQLPIQLEPGESTPLDLVYTPMTDQIVNTSLQIVSNDELSPTTTVPVDADGVIENDNKKVWTVEGQQAVTAIINVNEYAIGYGFGDDMRDFLPVFFEGLHDAGVSYRIGFVMNEEGYVSGDIPYIDDSFTVDDAVDAAQEMMKGSSLYGDNDTGLQTCLNALDQNDWLWDDDLWTQSRLNLVVVNSDQEQSAGNAALYTEAYDEYKNADDDTGDFVVHGIAGPAGGCSDGGGEYAEYAKNLAEAADSTGGVFIPICDDWNKSAPAFIDGFTGTIERFILDKGEPAPWSIEVSVDGARLFSGWTYDEKTKEIVFDDATYPSRGSMLSVYYVMAVSCD
jgi:hypothetical protein